MNTQYLVAMLVCITAIASFINYRFIKLPKTIGLTLLTLGVSIVVMILLSIGQAWVVPIKDMLGGIDFSHTVMNGMLSFLLFASALNINVLELSEYKKMVVSLATASVFISCFLIGFAVYWIGHLLGLNIPFIFCLLFGALIAPTDPICVINAMRGTNTPGAVRMKITGESLFNDAAGIVLFVLMLQIANGTTQNLDFLNISWMLIRQGIGGLLLGFILGRITTFFLTQVNNDETAILMTLALVTGGYSIATFADVSGPIAMVIAGLIVGNHCRAQNISQSTVFRLYSFWTLVDDVLNSFLFAMIGLEMLSVKGGWFAILIGSIAFFAIILVRFVSILIPTLFLEPIRANSWRTLTVMTWGGMRGGLSIALALSIPMGDHKELIVGITYAVVVLSILLQGLTLQPLIKKLFPTVQ